MSITSKVSNNVEKKQNSSGNVEVSSLKLLLYKYDEENASKGLPMRYLNCRIQVEKF